MHYVIYNVYYIVYYCGFMFRLFDGIVWHVNRIMYYVWSVVVVGVFYDCVVSPVWLCPDGFLCYIHVVLNTIYYE